MDQWRRWKALNEEATLHGKPMSSSGAIIRADAAIFSLESMLMRAATEVVDLGYQMSGTEYDQDRFQKDVDFYLRELAGGEP
jgi:hypothetical protein